MLYARRYFKRISAVILAAIFTTAFYSCGTERKYTATFTDTFDTVTTFTAYCASETEFNEAAERVHQTLVRLDGVFNIYDENSEVSRLNSTGEAELSADLKNVLDVSLEICGASGGKLNVYMGGVFALWHAFMEGGELPSEDNLRNASEHSGPGIIVLDGEYVSLTDSSASVDLGAVAKGYAAGLAADAASLDSFILSVGGNVVARGTKPGGENWTVGIENPEGGIIDTICLTGLAVVTSGDYQRYRDFEGVRYHHIIDPETCQPARLYRSVTVIHENSLMADALSTAIFCMPHEDGAALAEKYGAEVMWVYPDLHTERTEGFAEYEK